MTAIECIDDERAWIDEAASLPASERFCTHCEKRLRGRFTWLELDQRIDAYHDFGEVPEERSQGWFPIGMTCAKKLRADARKRLGLLPETT
jgi:hypothetical protein